jgi:Ca2+-binding EF-hand superfamily protein
MDTDKDGKVTASEMDAAHQRVTGQKRTQDDIPAAERIKRVDGDGVLTAQEHVAASKLMFDKMDADKNGLLTKAELSAGQAKLLKKANR